MHTLADLMRAATQAGETRLAAAIAPALPRLPDDALRTAAAAAGIATTHNPDTDA